MVLKWGWWHYVSTLVQFKCNAASKIDCSGTITVWHKGMRDGFQCTATCADILLTLCGTAVQMCTACLPYLFACKQAMVHQTTSFRVLPTIRFLMKQYGFFFLLFANRCAVGVLCVFASACVDSHLGQFWPIRTMEKYKFLMPTECLTSLVSRTVHSDSNPIIHKFIWALRAQKVLTKLLSR